MEFPNYLLKTGLKRFDTAIPEEAPDREERKMRTINHTLRIGTSAMLALVLGSYIYSSSAHASEYRNISRVMGGYHIQADNIAGLELGRNVAKEVLKFYKNHIGEE